MTSFQNLLILSLGRGLQVLAGLVTIKTATTLLSPSDVGSMNQLMSLAVLGTSAILTPVAAYIGRGCLDWMEGGTLSRRLGSYLLVVLAVAPILGFVAWAIQSQLMVVAGVGAVWVGGLVALYTLGFSLHSLGGAGLNLMGHQFLYILFGNVAAWGGAGLGGGVFEGRSKPGNVAAWNLLRISSLLPFLRALGPVCQSECSCAFL